MVARLLFFPALLAAAALGADAPPIRILFIGNSLTSFNRLPAVVEALGEANGQRIETRTIAMPDYSLEDHWKDGNAARVIAGGRWSFVVLQQGPSSQPESRILLVEYTRRFAEEAARAGARTALYMVWPSARRARDFDGVKLSYHTAASVVRGTFLPAGEAWRIAWRTNPELPLYGADGFHPSPLGTSLAALVIFQGITGKAPARLPQSYPADATLLLSAAAEALRP